MYPVLGAVPRLVPNAILDFYRFFEQNRVKIPRTIWSTNFAKENQKLLNKMLKKQMRTQDSFTLEWSFQGAEQKTWGFAPRERAERIVYKSLQMTAEDCKDKLLLDAGCGNGILTSELGDFFETVIGMDLGLSVVEAHQANLFENVHFIQADLINPPIKFQSIDVLISAGVLHHTPNTELAFSCLTPLVKRKGRCYVWLYKPERDLHHQIMIRLRKVFSRLPLRFSAFFILYTFVPLAQLKRRIMNLFSKKKETPVSWRTQLIAFLDGLTPLYRFEHTPEEVRVWFRKRRFSHTAVTIYEYLGFGVYGDRD